MNSALKKNHARLAIGTASRLRAEMGYQPWDSVCPYDIILEKSIELRFLGMRSMEGAYIQKGKAKAIIVSALRPYGRQLFTAAHELGHEIFDHGTMIDDVTELDKFDKRDPREFLADSFASALLMPQSLVERVFTSQGYSLENPSPIHCYLASGIIGVGYTTLVSYLQYSLRTISPELGQVLRRKTPAAIRNLIVGEVCPQNIFSVNESWMGRPVDLQLGDYIMTNHPLNCDSSYLSSSHRLLGGEFIYEAMRPGTTICSAESTGWNSLLRISSARFEGWYGNKYEEV